MTIQGKIVTIRAVEEGDLATLHRWGNDAALWSLLGGWRFPSSLDQTRAWFEGLKRDALNQRFAVEAEGRLVGTANLVDIDWKNRNAFHGMMIGDGAMRGRGIGIDVVMTIMRYAFDELGLHRLDGSIIDHNEASKALYCGKCGWQVEGRQRDWYYRDGRYWDRILVGVTADDYAKVRAYWD